MMIKQDVREPIWYSINNLLSVSPDLVSGYYAMLINHMRRLDDNKQRPICSVCSKQVIDFEKINERMTCPEHPESVIYETFRCTIKRLLNNLFDKLQEPSGYRFDLYDLELTLENQDIDMIFETRTGQDISKGQVLKDLEVIKRVCMDRLTELQSVIRFSAQMHTPPLKIMYP